MWTIQRDTTHNSKLCQQLWKIGLQVHVSIECNSKINRKTHKIRLDTGIFQYFIITWVQMRCKTAANQHQSTDKQSFRLIFRDCHDWVGMNISFCLHLYCSICICFLPMSQTEETDFSTNLYGNWSAWMTKTNPLKPTFTYQIYVFNIRMLLSPTFFHSYFCVLSKYLYNDFHYGNWRLSLLTIYFSNSFK